MKRPPRDVRRPSLAALAGVLAALFAGPPAAAQESPPPVEGVAVDLGDALRQALERNWQVRIRRQDVISAEAAVMAASSMFDPQVQLDADGSDYQGRSGGQSFLGTDPPDAIDQSFSAKLGLSGLLPTGTTLSAQVGRSYSRQYQLYPDAFGDQDLEIDSRYWNTSATLGLTQHLLKGLGPSYNLASLREAKLGRDVAELDRDREAQDVAGQVLKAWWDLRYAARAEEIARLAAERARDQGEVTRARIEVGDLAPIEIWKVEEAVAAREGELLQAQVASRLAAQALRLLLAPDAGDPLARALPQPAGDGGIALPARDLEASLQASLLGNAEVLLARRSLESRRIRLAVAAHDRLPALDLQASLSLNGYRDTGPDAEPPEGAFGSTNRTMTIGATLTLPLGGRQATAAFRQRKADVESALLQQQALEAQVVSSVEQAWWTVQSQEEQARVASARVESARKSAEAEDARYRVGKATTRDVLDAEAILKEAELMAERARLDALKARVDLEAVRGSLLDALGLEVR